MLDGSIKIGGQRATGRRMGKNARSKSRVTYSGDIASKVSHAQGTATIRRRFIGLSQGMEKVKRGSKTLQTHSEFTE